MEKTNQPPIKQAVLTVADISVGRTNPRKEFDTESINELAASIKEQGVLQPILCRPKGEKFELVCGERRLRASKIAGLTEIPAVIRDLTDDQALELQIIENLQRKDVHPLEEAFAYKSLIAIKKMSPEEISKRVGKTKTYISQRLKLNDLSKDFQKAVYEGRLSLVDALRVCKLSSDFQKEMWEDEFENNAGKVEVNNRMVNSFLGDLHDAPFDLKDPNIKKDMGPCSTCHHNTASATSLFPESEGKARCLLVSCFKQKSEISFKVQLEKSINDPTITLVSGTSGESKVKTDLRKKNIKVLEMRDYNEFEKPDEIDEKSEYEDQLEFGDFDSREEMEEEYKKDLEAYNKECDKYKRDCESGKYPKAFVVDGSDAGKYIFIRVNNSGVQNSSQKAVKEKMVEGKVTKADIENEITRIRDREKRAKELDIEKVSGSFDGLFAKTTDKMLKNKELSIPEVKAAIVMLVDYGGYSFESKFYKLIGSGGGSDHSHMKVYKYLEGKTINQLWTYYIAGIRAVMHQKLQVNTPNYEKNGKSAVVYDILKHYDAPGAKKIIEDQKKESEARGERVESKIKALKNQLTPKPAAKKAASKNPVIKKGLSDLLDNAKKSVKKTVAKKKK